MSFRARAAIRKSAIRRLRGLVFAEADRMKIFGIVLIVVGLLALAFGGISWTKREKVVDLGPIQAETRKRETLPLPPIFGGVAVVAGIALIVVSGRR
jgi:uncharacterized membrane protein YidH (DUF202 family)